VTQAVNHDNQGDTQYISYESLWLCAPIHCLTHNRIILLATSLNLWGHVFAGLIYVMLRNFDRTKEALVMLIPPMCWSPCYRWFRSHALWTTTDGGHLHASGRSQRLISMHA